MTTLTVSTGSENTIKAYEFLKENAGNAFTIAEVAEALGLTSAQVTGGLVSLAKKEVVLRSEKEGIDKTGATKNYKAFEANPEFEVVFEKTSKGSSKVSDNGLKLLKFLQTNPTEELTHGELAEALEWKTIQAVGAATSLAKFGLVAKPEVEVEMPDGTIKLLKVVVLTDEGKNYSL